MGGAMVVGQNGAAPQRRSAVRGTVWAMKRSLSSAPQVAVIGLVLCASIGAGQPATQADAPFDVMERLYKPILGPDELGWALKVDSASRSELKFLTSTRELFFGWAKTRCADWLGDAGAYVTCHGDVH